MRMNANPALKYMILKYIVFQVTPRFILVRAYNGHVARQIPDRLFESRPPVILLITRGLSRFARKKVPARRGARHPDRSINNAKRMSGDPRTGPSIAHGGGSRFAITPNMQLPSKWISTHPFSRVPTLLPPSTLPTQLSIRSRVECTEHFTRRALWFVDSNSNLRKSLPILPTSGVLLRIP